MNRWDEIQAVARDIASNVHRDPEKVTAMADDLIRLAGLMVAAVGKSVTIEGESSMDDEDDTTAYTRYLVGERIQDGARAAVEEASSAGCDLERWRRTDPRTVGCRCGHIPSVHGDTGFCTGEKYNGAPCRGGQCTEFVAREPEGGWVYQDRRPDIRAVVREELEAAARRQEQMAKQAVADHWASDAFKREVERLRNGTATRAPRVTLTNPLFPGDCNCRPLFTEEGDQHEATCALVMRDSTGTAVPEVTACPNCGRNAGCCRPPNERCPLHDGVAIRSGSFGPPVCDVCKFGGNCCYPLGDVCPLHH